MMQISIVTLNIYKSISGTIGTLAQSIQSYFNGKHGFTPI
jgi:hypothetical protein